MGIEILWKSFYLSIQEVEKLLEVPWPPNSEHVMLFSGANRDLCYPCDSHTTLLCPHQFPCWRPKPLCEYIWDEVSKRIIKAKWGHERGPWPSGIRALRRDTCAPSVSPHARGRRAPCSCLQAGKRLWLGNSPPPELQENKVLLCEPPSLWCFLMVTPED